MSSKGGGWGRPRKGGAQLGGARLLLLTGVAASCDSAVAVCTSHWCGCCRYYFIVYLALVKLIACMLLALPHMPFSCHCHLFAGREVHPGVFDPRLPLSLTLGSFCLCPFMRGPWRCCMQVTCAAQRGRRWWMAATPGTAWYCACAALRQLYDAHKGQCAVDRKRDMRFVQ